MLNWDSIKTKENEENYCNLMAGVTLAKDWDSEADKVWDKYGFVNAKTM